MEMIISTAVGLLVFAALQAAVTLASAWAEAE